MSIKDYKGQKLIVLGIERSANKISVDKVKSDGEILTIQEKLL